MSLGPVADLAERPATFQRRTSSSSQVVKARMRPSGENATVRRDRAWPSRLARRWPVSTLQSPNMPSLPAVARSDLCSSTQFRFCRRSEIARFGHQKDVANEHRGHDQQERDGDQPPIRHDE